MRWVNEMIQYGEIQPQPVLGLSISLIPETLPDGEQGLEIVEVTPGLSGDKAGILVGCLLYTSMRKRLDGPLARARSAGRGNCLLLCAS